ncbi:MAG: restriction endonuclease subunit S [Chlorobium sp.]
MSRYQRYPAYRDSGVEWIGEIPEHWEVKRLRFVVQLNPSKKEITLDDSQLVSFVPMDSVCEYGGIDPLIEKELLEVNNGYTFFANNDVVVAKITPCFENGKGALAINLTNNIAFGTTELHVLRSEKSILPEFLFYLSISYPFRALGESTMYGAGGQKRIPEIFIKNFLTPIPPLEEQRSIASFLDRKTAQIDELIAKKEALLKKLDEKRTALITRAVTKGLDPSAPMKESGLEWLGKIPAHWSITALHHITTLKSGESIIATMMDENEEFPVYGGNGFRGYFSSYTHNGDYILIGRQGALCGNINYASGKFWASEHAIVLTPTKTIISTWLGELLKAMNLNQYSVSAAQPGLSAEVIGRLKIPLPPLYEQQAIVEQIEKKTATIDRQKAQVTEAIERLKEYRTALITDAVTGRMVIHSFGKRESLSA